MRVKDGDKGPVPAGQDSDAYDRLRRRVLWSLPSGLYVVGSRSGERRNLMTCNWVMQMAITPKLVAVSVERGSVTRALIAEGGGFSVSVLSRADRALIRKFVKPVVDVETDQAGTALTMQGEPVHEVEGGLPCLEAAVGWLSCRVRHTGDWAGPDGRSPVSHVLYVGEVVDVGERVGPGTDRDAPEILRMEDTRMNYGG